MTAGVLSGKMYIGLGYVFVDYRMFAGSPGGGAQLFELSRYGLLERYAVMKARFAKFGFRARCYR